MSEFLRRLFGGRVSPEQREEVLAFMADAWKIQSLQDAEAARHNDVLTKYGGSATLDSSALAEIIPSARRQSEVYADLRQWHTKLGPVPDEAGACYFKWESTYLALEEWASATLAWFEGTEAGATPHTERVEQSHLAEQRAEREARGEEAKLLKRLGASAEDIRRLIQESEAEAASELDKARDE